MRSTRSLAGYAAGVLATLALAACGGGGTADAPETTSSSDAVSSSAADAGASVSAVANAATPTTQALAAAATVARRLSTTTFGGKGWYVDSSLGNDSNPGTSSAPLKTLAAVGKKTFSAGDAVLLKCGSTWREALTLTNGNAPKGNLTLGVYGTCTSTNLPVISGSNVVAAGWKAGTGFGANPVYVATWSQPVSYLYWNGTPLVKARYPNFGGIGKEFSLIASTASSTSFKLSQADFQAIGNVNLAGATAYIRTAPWTIEAVTIASNNTSDGTITLSKKTTYPIEAQEGYYIEGKLPLLNAPGEWYQDPSTGLLYVWTPTGVSPSTGLLESIQRATGVSIVSIPNTKVDQIVVAQTTTTAVKVSGSKQTILNGLTVKDALSVGILIDGGTTAGDSTGTQITGATISNAGSTGIILKSPSTSVTNSAVDGTSTSPIVTTQDSAINAIADGVVIQNNTITHSGLRAIELGAVSGGLVTGNVVTQACMRLTDCGGIYTYGKPVNPQRTTVSSNSVSNMVPNSVGAIGGAPTLVAGIYLDEASNSLDIVNNMVTNVGTGIKLHDASSNNVLNNSVWLTTTASLMVQSSTTTSEMVRGNLIQNNLFYAASYLLPANSSTTTPSRTVVYPQMWMHYSNAPSMFTGTSPNVVVNNVAGTMAADGKVQWQLTSGSVSTNYNVQQWAAYATGEQIKSAYAAVELVAQASGPELVQNNAFTTPGKPWQTWFAGQAPGQSVAFGTCSTGCVTFVPGSTYDAISSSTFTMNSAAGTNLYLLHFKATGLAPTTSIYVATARVSDGTNIGIGGGFGLVSFEQSNYQQLFFAKASDLGHLVINGIAGQGFKVSDMGAYQVASYKLYSPTGETALLTNESTSPRSIACASTGLRTCTAADLNGNPVSWPVTLAPNSALAVVTNDATWKPTN